ncbi:putative F-box protein [Camellia lanceoleosa]|uniref:F-box protein n=1 Tax=Camellia lanceoleosa TaxID=1840588 RepID=A0ACC0IIT5_9ERIC|nr:putative F-box protein [Camellia lanceoleosa]
MASSSRLWSDLHDDLLEIIFEDLTDFFDLLRCRTVCHSWRSAAKKVCNNITIPPLLLLPPKQTISKEYAKLVSASKVYSIHSPNTLARTRCLSSYHGWLLMADIEDPCTVYLYNPVSRVHVQLPSLPERDYPTPLRFVTSCSPDDPGCSVLVLYDHMGSHNGCICKPGDAEWWKTLIDMSWCIDDMMYYNGELYAIDKHGTLKRLKYADPYIEEEVSAMATGSNRSTPWRYLAKSPSGELLMVVRHVESCMTKFLEVYKFDWSEGVWEEVRNTFGDQALLLAHNDSVFVDAGNIYRPNCIYFVDDLWVGDSNSHSHDYGVYELGNGKIEQFYQFQQRQIVNAASFYRWFRLL